MEQINIILDFLKVVVVTTLSQIVGIFGIFFLFGFVLYLLEKFTTNCFLKTVGRKGVLWTAWLGTPIHELGHAFFCLIFMHRITEINLYEPDQNSGVLGYVRHEYDLKSTYQRIGNFFIGAGPLIFGSIAMYVALHYLVPNSADVFNVVMAKSAQISSSSEIIDQFKIFGITCLETLRVLFSQSNLFTFKFWIFLYISFCIASHIAPSPSDMKEIWMGLKAIILVLLLINFFTLLLGFNVSKYILLVNQYNGFLIALFIYSIIISLINFILSYFFLSIYSKKKYGVLLNPF